MYVNLFSDLISSKQWVVDLFISEQFAVGINREKSEARALLASTDR